MKECIFPIPKMQPIFLELHQGLYFGVRQEQHLSRSTPVLDNFPRSEKIIQTCKEAILEYPHGIFDVFVIGESGAGKGTLAEELLKRVSEARELRPRRLRKHLTKKYYSLAMGLNESYAAGLMTSAWGVFTPEEYERNIDHMSQRLRESESLPKPLFRVIETVAICEPPIAAGAALIKNAAKRAKEDPTYHFLVIGVTSKNDVQERAMTVREGLRRSTHTQDAKMIFTQNTIKPDELDNIQSIQRSMGSKEVIQITRTIDNDHMVQMQSNLRDLEPSLPNFTLEDLEANNQLRTFALQTFIRYRLLEWGVLPEHMIIGENEFIPKRKIPYYRRYILKNKL